MRIDVFHIGKDIFAAHSTVIVVWRDSMEVCPSQIRRTLQVRTPVNLDGVLAGWKIMQGWVADKLDADNLLSAAITARRGDVFLEGERHG